jgi:GTP diphosphokinase / guanosine-3',5'-bis(diphosphate) 3'-diphosphatase
MDTDLYKKALDFATLAHDGQKRLSGEPFIAHPIAVAQTLQKWHLDDTAIIAGLLHDTVEDGGATRADIVKEFGEEVATIVDGVTKITKIHLKGSTNEQFVENLRKMLLVMAQDLRVVLVKLADRLHNMQTLEYLSAEKQKENAKETLEIYAPLAERLGIGEVKGTLEDLSFKYAFPEKYEALTKITSKSFAEEEMYAEKFKKQLYQLLQKKIPGVVINARRKHLYSLFRKLERPEIDGDINKLHDLVASRVLVNTVEECYLALGAIHGKWHPVPYLGVSDFIANPKPNGYRSIHTKIFGPEGRIVEIQIRTFEMHQQAEMGVAAHWQYAQAKSHGASDEKLEKGSITTPGKLSWVKQLAGWQKEITDSEEYLRVLRFDALQHRNLVFSPIGDVYDLPRGATPIDYAYAVHTKLGHQAKGAKVNGKMVPLSHQLVNGDVVEIFIDRNRKKPSHEWLSFVVTTDARQAISKELKN